MKLYFRYYFNKGGVHHGRSCKGGFETTKSVLEIGSQYECEVLKHTAIWRIEGEGLLRWIIMHGKKT